MWWSADDRIIKFYLVCSFCVLLRSAFFARSFFAVERDRVLGVCCRWTELDRIRSKGVFELCLSIWVRIDLILLSSFSDFKSMLFPGNKGIFNDLTNCFLVFNCVHLYVCFVVSVCLVVCLSGCSFPCVSFDVCLSACSSTSPVYSCLYLSLSASLCDYGAETQHMPFPRAPWQNPRFGKLSCYFLIRPVH